MVNQTDMLKRYFLTAIISLFLLVGLSTALAYVVGSSTYSERLLMTLGAVFLYGVISIFSLRLSSQKDFSKYLSYVSLFFASLAFIISMLLIWDVFTGASENVFRVLSISLVVTLYFSVLGLVSGKLPNKVTKYAFFSTVILMMLNAVFFSFLIIADAFPQGILPRLFWALNILILVGVITIPIGRRL